MSVNTYVYIQYIVIRMLFHMVGGGWLQDSTIKQDTTRLDYDGVCEVLLRSSSLICSSSSSSGVWLMPMLNTRHISSGVLALITFAT